MPTVPMQYRDGSNWSKASTPVTLEEAERSHILDTLQQTDGLVGGRNGAAARLGMPLTTLISKMKRLGIFSTVGPNLKRSSSSDLSAEWNFS
jgi:transcriptional regulator with GAF, ATPase, and Fis domain